MKLQLIPILSNRFTYIPSTKTFTVDISDFGKRGCDLLFQPIYDDACDIGFLMKSTKTGKEVLFVFSHESLDPEGEIVEFVFNSTEGNYRLVVIND